MPLFPIMPPQGSPYGKGTCPQCGFLLSDGDRRCPMCHKRRSGGRPGLLALILIGALLAVLIAWRIMLND